MPTVHTISNVAMAVLVIILFILIFIGFPSWLFLESLLRLLIKQSIKSRPMNTKTMIKIPAFPSCASLNLQYDNGLLAVHWTLSEAHLVAVCITEQLPYEKTHGQYI